MGDATRRRIVGRLAAGPLAVAEIARDLPVGRPAVSMHLRVLKSAGLVTDRAAGNRRLYYLNPAALARLREHLDWYWAEALAAYKSVAEAVGTSAGKEAAMNEDPDEIQVRRSVVVEVGLADAFRIFLDQAAWWPVKTHHIAEPAGDTVVLEPYVGGRWYERAGDGTETDWGRVLVFEPPHRLLLSWQVSPEWTYEPDPARASEIEVRFTAEAAGRTRVELDHRHLERYGSHAERMRTILEGPEGAVAPLRAYAAAAAATHPARR